MKILLISHCFPPDVGGIETISEYLAEAFAAAGHEVHVMTWTLGETGRQAAYTIIRQPGLLVQFRQYAWAEVVLENNPALRLSWPNFFFRRPSVIALQTWLTHHDQKKPLSHKLKYWWLSRSASVIAISEAMRKRVWPSATLVHNAYNETLFRTMPDVAKTKDFVFVGRLVSDKGADLAIRAIKELTKQKSSQESTLTIVGDGPEKAKLEMMAVQLGVESLITFSGFLKGEALAVCMNQHRYLLVPSRWSEPFGIVALEGMACGCIPIVSDGGGLPDAVGDAGLIFRREDFDHLLTTIKELMNNKELKAKLHAAAKEHLSIHSVRAISNQYLQLLIQAVN